MREILDDSSLWFLSDCSGDPVGTSVDDDLSFDIERRCDSAPRRVGGPGNVSSANAVAGFGAPSVCHAVPAW